MAVRVTRSTVHSPAPLSAVAALVLGHWVRRATRPRRRMSIQAWGTQIPDNPVPGRELAEWLVEPEERRRVCPAWTLAEAQTVYTHLSQVYEIVAAAGDARERKRLERALAVLYQALREDPQVRRLPS